MQAENVVERSVAMPSKASIAKTDPTKQAEVEKRIHVLANLMSGDVKRAERYFQLATVAVSKSPGLLEVSKEKLWLAIQTIASLALDIGSMGAYLLPYKGDAQVIISPQGLVELMLRSGLVRDVQARVVYAHDTFDINYGVTQSVTHKPTTIGDKGEPIGAYAVITLASGGIVIEYMTRSEIEDIRGRSPSWTSSRGPSGPWKTDPMEMWRKTVLKRAAKYAPKSAEVRDAIEIDNGEYEALPNESDASRPRALLASGRGVRGTLARLGVANDVEAQESHAEQASGDVGSTSLPI